MDAGDFIYVLCATDSDASTPAPLSPARFAHLEEVVACELDGELSRLEDRSLEELVVTLGLSHEMAGTVRNRLERAEYFLSEKGRLAEEGVWVVARGAKGYPGRLSDYLGHQAPPLLFGAGSVTGLDLGGLAIVGSRKITEEVREYATEVGRACGEQGIGVVSGGARGVDLAAMGGALTAGGCVTGVVAESLSKVLEEGSVQSALEEGALTLCSPSHPAVPFSSGLALWRNKMIFALADWGLVVESRAGMGGSWQGATDTLRRGERPVFVRPVESRSSGNAALIRRGAQAFPAPPWGDLQVKLDALKKESGDLPRDRQMDFLEGC